MDELKILRDAWGDADAPSQSAHAQARATLLARAGGQTQASRRRRRGFRLPRIGVRLAMVGALAAAIAAGVTVVQNSGGTDKDGRPRSMLPGIPAGPVANAAEALDRAAAAADSRPFTPPRPDQWIYIELRIRTTAKESGVATGGPYRTIVRRSWERGDGKKSARVENGQVKIFNEFSRTVPPSDYPSLAALPTDPDALLRWVDAQNGAKPGSEGAYQFDFETLNVILRENLLPPRTEAAIFRAMKKIPGVVLVDNSADAAGRPAIALGRIAEGWLHEEVMLDPKTYAYLGERAISIKGHTSRGAGDDPTAAVTYVKKGVLQNLTVRTGAGIVDEPGRRTS
ncbi:CU044_5270 family protein [Actinoallomurus sp. NPDC052274]|uniref:CU044_5270 family protein n=1 Tax=Actinoallomurus sp. NPDC052274 TaxID=3155420 RepID=UPI003422A658